MSMLCLGSRLPRIKLFPLRCGYIHNRDRVGRDPAKHIHQNFHCVAWIWDIPNNGCSGIAMAGCTTTSTDVISKVRTPTATTTTAKHHDRRELIFPPTRCEILPKANSRYRSLHQTGIIAASNINNGRTRRGTNDGIQHPRVVETMYKACIRKV